MMRDGRRWKKDNDGKIRGSYPSSSGENKGTASTEKKDLTKDKKGVTIKSSEFLKSLRGVGKNYPVRKNDNGKPFGDHCKLDTKKDIEKAEAFAGKGTKREIRNRRFLESSYNIPADEWQKCSGFGHVIIDGKSTPVELHWYQAQGVRVDLKIKPRPIKTSKE